MSLAKTAQDFCFPKGRLHLFVFALRSLIRPFLYTAPTATLYSSCCWFVVKFYVLIIVIIVAVYL